MSIFERLRVFVSSSMDELADERQIVKAALDALKVEAWVFEEDAHASTESVQQTFLKEIEKDDLYIGLFWKGYGDYTIEEYEHARKLGKDCLIYEKRIDLDGQRDPRLQTFLDRVSQVESGHTIRWFNTPDELGECVKEDVAAWQAFLVRERHTPRITLHLSLAGTPLMLDVMSLAYRDAPEEAVASEAGETIAGGGSVSLTRISTGCLCARAKWRGPTRENRRWSGWPAACSSTGRRCF